MESSRCPRCAALVPQGAPWCGQCYADLRPAAPELDPLTAPLAAVEAGLAASSPLPSLAAPVALATEPEPAAIPAATQTAVSAGRPTWPCLRCQHVNDVADDACQRCGGGFLAGVEQADIALPGIGRARSMERSHKIALVVAGSAALMLFLLGMSIILGSLV